MNMSEAVSKKHSLVFVSKLSDKKCRINSFLFRLIGLLCNAWKHCGACCGALMWHGQVDWRGMLSPSQARVHETWR